MHSRAIDHTSSVSVPSASGRGKVTIPACEENVHTSPSVQLSETKTERLNNGFGYVAIKCKNAVPDSIEHKAFASFLHTHSQKWQAINSGTQEDIEIEPRHIAEWMADLTGRGIAPSTRLRYLRKMRATIGVDLPQGAEILLTHPGAPTELHDLLETLLSKLQKIESMALGVSDDSPIASLLLYLFLNPSSTLEQAILLTTDDSKLDALKEQIPSLKNILTPRHHRQRYLFSLSQTRKRLPQLKRDTVEALTQILRDLGVYPLTISSLLPSPDALLRALWLTHSLRISKTSFYEASLLASSSCLILPSTHKYLSAVGFNPDLGAVASTLTLGSSRWHAMRLNRSTSYQALCNLLKEAGISLSNTDSELTERTVSLFYPTFRRARKIEGKLRFDTLPFLPRVVFFKASEALMPALAAATVGHAWIYRRSRGANAPWSIISEAEMTLFQRAAAIACEGVNGLNLTLGPRPSLSSLSPGTRVRITDGPFAGYEARIHKALPSSTSSSSTTSVSSTDTSSTVTLFSLTLTAGSCISWTLSIEDCFLQPLD